MMSKLTVLLAVLFLLTTGTGCLGLDLGSGDEEIVEPPAYSIQTEWFNDSYAFMNALRTGHMSQFDSDVEAKNSSVTIYLNFTCRFEDRAFQQSGYINITIEEMNGSGEMLYSQEWAGDEQTVNETVLLSNFSGEIQLRVRAEGSDGELSGGQQDYYDLGSTLIHVRLLDDA
jgi:hypothetical protein